MSCAATSILQDRAMTRHQPADVCNESLQHATVELVRRLQAGEPCRAESLFAAYPDLSAHEEAALELIYSEFVTCRQLGEKPTPDEWYGRFPHWRSAWNGCSCFTRSWIPIRTWRRARSRRSWNRLGPSLLLHPRRNSAVSSVMSVAKRSAACHGRRLQGRAVRAGTGSGH